MEGDEPYFVEIGETLAGRQAGGSALAKASELQADGPKGVFRLFRKGEDWSWRRGAAGEKRVAKELAQLPKGEWYVFHDIPLGSRGTNIDHLVVGPSGVFSLNAKNLSGKVWVAERAFLHNGYRTDFLPKSRREAERVKRCLGTALGRDVAIRAVLVLMCGQLTIKAQPMDVTVVTRRELRRWLLARPHVLRADEAIQVAAKAHHPETWVMDRASPRPDWRTR